MELANHIWSVADLLRGDYKQSDYGKVILPLLMGGEPVAHPLDDAMPDLPSRDDYIGYLESESERAEPTGPRPRKNLVKRTWRRRSGTRSSPRCWPATAATPAVTGPATGDDQTLYSAPITRSATTQQIGQRQVDHSASRRNASAYLGISSSSTRSSRSARLCCSTYSRMACLAHSCMERRSSAARWRSASASSSGSRKVMATGRTIPPVVSVAGERNARRGPAAGDQGPREGRKL